MKLYKATLRTGGKTDDQLRAKVSGKPLPGEIEWARKSYAAWDGLKCVVKIDTDGDYALYDVDKSGMAQYKEAMYVMEQHPMFGMYHNARKRFERDWAANEYLPDASIVFSADEVEIVSEVPHELDAARAALSTDARTDGREGETT